jgi:hypothetical protein
VEDFLGFESPTVSLPPTAMLKLLIREGAPVWHKSCNFF